MAEPFKLETERLILRAFRDEDIGDFRAYRSDPDVARYQSWDAPYSREDAARFLEAMRATIPGMPGEWYQAAIERREDGRLLGDCAFCVLAEDMRQAEIGFTLARANQGQGYATEAITRLLGFLFEEFGLHRVRAVCDVQNARSARLMERLGMRREGCLVEAEWFKGRWSTECLYAILRREWQGGPASRNRAESAKGVVTYTLGRVPETADALSVFRRSGLENPITDPNRMAKLLETADVLVCAWRAEQLVGLARGLTDFLYTCYLSDLVVDSGCQGQGIGQELIRRVRTAVGRDVRVHLFAAPAAQSYYERLGFPRADDCFRIPTE